MDHSLHCRQHSWGIILGLQRSTISMQLSQKHKINGGYGSVFSPLLIPASLLILCVCHPWFGAFSLLTLIVFCSCFKQKLGRRALIGFCASLVSDTTSNSIRVTKVTKQAHTEPVTYVQAVREVVSKDGITGLLFRGLGTRLIANGMQGMMFSGLSPTWMLSVIIFTIPHPHYPPPNFWHIFYFN